MNDIGTTYIIIKQNKQTELCSLMMCAFVVAACSHKGARLANVGAHAQTVRELFPNACVRKATSSSHALTSRGSTFCHWALQGKSHNVGTQLPRSSIQDLKTVYLCPMNHAGAARPAQHDSTAYKSLFSRVRNPLTLH